MNQQLRLLNLASIKLFIQPLFLALIITAGITGQVYASEPNEPVSTGRPTAGVAAGGHDVTAYHSLEPTQTAVPGAQTYVATWKGAQWRFVSRADRDRFVATPKTFAPAYNGFCANALSLGEGLIRTDGSVWAIFDNQLYFFYAPRGARRWKSGDYQVYRQDATSAWNAIVAGRPK